MIRYSVLMPYYNRSYQLYKTLRSFDHHYKDRDDYEIIVAEDVKTIQDFEQHQRLVDVVSVFKDLNIIHIKTNYKGNWNPAPLYCDMADMATGKYFIITNPEVVHKVSILNELDTIFSKDENSYVVCSCESIKDYKSFDDYTHLTWFQHSVHRNRLLHFCSAISKKNYFKIGGFDKRFMIGVGRDDEDFIRKVKESNLHILVRDDLETLHLDHVRPRIYNPNFDKLWDVNKKLFTEIHGN